MYFGAWGFALSLGYMNDADLPRTTAILAAFALGWLCLILKRVDELRDELRDNKVNIKLDIEDRRTI